MSNLTTPEKRRRRKRAQILTRLDTLKDEPASLRTRTMNKEFGPYWYFYLDLNDGMIPTHLKHGDRYHAWTAELNRAKVKTKDLRNERLALWKSLSTSPK